MNEEQEKHICENPKCRKEHDGSYSKRFCSQHCRQSYVAMQSHKHRRTETIIEYCEKCGKPFEIRKNYWHKTICQECRDKEKREEFLKKEPPIVKGICKFCHKEFERRTWNKTTQFCCDKHAKQFAAQYNREETNKKISEALKGKTHSINCFDCGQEIIVPLSTVKALCPKCKEEKYGWTSYCVICGRPIKGARKTCSKECQEESRVRSFKKTQSIRHGCGGEREGSGRSISGRYKGIYCASTWELCFVIYCLDNNIPIKRYNGFRTYFFENKERKYYPDFLVNGNSIVEIKGFKTAASLAKAAANPDIQVLYENDMEKYFNWVKEKYGTSDFKTLYDDKEKYVKTESDYLSQKFIWMHNDSLRKNTMATPKNFEEHKNNGWIIGRKKYSTI